MAHDDEGAATQSILRQLAATQVGFRTLLLDIPDYWRRLVAMLRAPAARLGDRPADALRLKRSLAFMLQGLLIAFVLFTLGRTLPQSVAGWTAVNLPLITGTVSDLERHVERIRAVTGVLPSDLADAWQAEAELVLLVRVLSEDRFARLMERLEAVAAESPQRLRAAVNGSLTHGQRFGGRGYLFMLMAALTPDVGPLLGDTYDYATVGPRHELQPHVAYLLRGLLYWYVSCLVAAWALRAMTGSAHTSTVLALGACWTGVLMPLVEAVETLVLLYLAVTLPAYIELASGLLVGESIAPLVAWTGGVVPGENLVVGALRGGVPLALLVLAVAGAAGSLQRACGVPRGKAVVGVVAGVGLGLAFAEMAEALVVLVVAPTGLL
jgi:hypothetical protein